MVTSSPDAKKPSMLEAESGSVNKEALFLATAVITSIAVAVGMGLTVGWRDGVEDGAGVALFVAGMVVEVPGADVGEETAVFVGWLTAAASFVFAAATTAGAVVVS